jgi:N-acyl-D-amino-acid deacylase
MGSDAYATGSALAVLAEVGKSEGEVYRRGVKWLLAAQKEDGSWHVATRSKPIQKHFESGFPHGKDQFISISATCWAVAALAATAKP